MRKISHPHEVLTADRSFRWTHRIADVLMTADTSMRVFDTYREKRAPIVHFGEYTFEKENYEGKILSWNRYRELDDPERFVPVKYVGIGGMDENWGWLSTYILNRTVNWSLNLYGFEKTTLSSQEISQSFLDDPNLLMLLVNQHSNISHPKVLSMPLGVPSPGLIFSIARRLLNRTVSNTEFFDTSRSSKDKLLLTIGSNYGVRPAIRQCVKQNMGEHLTVFTKRVSPGDFYWHIAHSMAVLGLPGLGYDTYRIWETLLLGSIPVIERGVGLDRTLYRLPALIVDDFADVTPELVRTAYIEALYWADEWEYDRLKFAFWKDIVTNVSASVNADYLMERFPRLTDFNFTRPQFPFDCVMMGGCCDSPRKRIPKQYCAIDTNTDWNTYEIQSDVKI